MANRGGYGGQDIDDLVDLDEGAAKSLSVKVKFIFKIVAGLYFFAYVVLTNLDKIGLIKSQSLSLESKTEIIYNMTSDFLPIH